MQQFPTPQRPFIFFHLRKSGGSAVRREIAASAVQINASFYIECELYGGHHNMLHAALPPINNAYARHMAACHTLDISRLLGLPHAQKTSVFAGVFSYGRMLQQLEYLHHYGHPRPYADRIRPMCLVFVRDPVARFESCYNEYFRGSGPPLANKTLREVETLLRSTQNGGFGCSNEILRFFGDDDDARVNAGNVTRETVEDAKQRLDACVVGNMVERNAETRALVRHHFPWLTLTGHNTGHRSGPRHPLRAEVVQRIREHQRIDIELYNYAMRRFETHASKKPFGRRGAR
jgi:hypothetical protein